MKTIMCLMLAFAAVVMCSTGEGSVPETSFMQGMLELPDASASTQFTSVTEARAFGDRWLGAQRRQTGHRYGDHKYRAAAIAFRKGAAAARRGQAKTAMKAFRAAKHQWRIARNRYLKKSKRRLGGRKGLRKNCRRVRHCHVRPCSHRHRKKKKARKAKKKASGIRPGYYKIVTTAVHAGKSAAQPAGWGLSAWGAHGARRNHVSSWAAVHSGNHWPMVWKIDRSKRTKGTYTIKTTKFGPKSGGMKPGWGLGAWHAHGAVRNHASSRVAVHAGNYWLMDWKIQKSKRTRGAYTIKTWGGPKAGKQPKGWGLSAWQKHGGKRNHASSWVYVHSGNHWLMDWKLVRVHKPRPKDAMVQEMTSEVANMSNDALEARKRARRARRGRCGVRVCHTRVVCKSAKFFRSERQIKKRKKYAKRVHVAKERAMKAAKENKGKRAARAKKRALFLQRRKSERNAKHRARVLKRKERRAKDGEKRNKAAKKKEQAGKKEKKAKAYRKREQKAKRVAKERSAKVRAERAAKAKAREQSHKRRVREQKAKAVARERKSKEQRSKAVARERKAKKIARERAQKEKAAKARKKREAAAKALKRERKAKAIRKERAQKVARERSAKHHERIAKKRAAEKRTKQHQEKAKKKKERAAKAHARRVAAERHGKKERGQKERANKIRAAEGRKKAQAKAAERQRKHHARVKAERSHKHRERHSKNVCVVHAYEHNNFRGRAHGWAVRASKQVIRMPNYGRRRGYQASSFKMSGQGCRMVQLWDEDRCHENYRDNVNIRSSVRSVKWDLNDDICAITVWGNRLRM